MKTFYVATTHRDLTNHPLRDFSDGNDYAIFDCPRQLERFVNGEASYNALDDSTRLFSGEQLTHIFCILAENYLEAVHRAWTLCRR